MERKRKHVIGVTGNIASGKTVVLDMLAELGAQTIDADRLVHEMMGPGSELAEPIRRSFGDAVVNEDGSINRPELGKIVFTDPAKLEELEHIVHPAVVERMLAEIANPDPPVLVLDAIKLFEAGIANHCDEVWVVDADRDVRIERLMNRSNFTREQAEQRVDVQPPQEEKIARADVVIDNGGTLDATRQQVEREWNRLVDD